MGHRIAFQIHIGQSIVIDCVHAMLAKFENDGKCDGSKLLRSVHTIPARFENGMKLDVAISTRVHVEEITYTIRIDQALLEIAEKCSVSIVFECSYHVVFELCWLGFHFQNLPFSKSAGKKCAVFV